ncbi:three-Cys-motif partner protein TcmP [Archangium violaceum]|uniref:three-Cys-motif partner protein TcmP n=1 Tax=Archangium violaceum TaxID=83451 RepID=UPI00094955F5|nr:three-Cys-motif partner protein TcmP [Archangium violaceum]
MATRKRTTSQGRAHRFGGDWTSEKLDVLANYLQSYTTALKDKPSKESPFRKAYIDAFAGTGYRTRQYEESDGGQSALLFPDLAASAPQQLLDGSARLALKTQPRFDRYIFIERSPDRCAQLEALKQEFPDLANDILIHQGDANEEIQALCNKDWRSRRAVLFLDPYGMQVEWSTIEAIAKTRAIDLWVLFPLGIGVNRLLTRSGEIPPMWRKRLDLLLGTKDWYEEFYKVESTPDLFGTEEERVIKASMETIGRYFNKRLKSVFADVAPDPRVLRNSANCPLYLLCFAVGNPKGAPIALRIANHLLTKGVQ